MNSPQGQPSSIMPDLTSLIAHTEQELRHLFSTDPYLNDLPVDVSLEEVLSQIAVAQGKSITVYVKRGQLPQFKVVVPHSTTTVLHLKKAIRRHYELDQRRQRKVDSDPRSTVDPPRPTSDNRERPTLGQPSTSSHRRHQSSSDHQSCDRDRDRKTANHPRVESSTHSTRFVGESSQRRVSWRFIWRTYHLDLDGVRLLDDGKCIKDYGVGNKSVLRFVKKHIHS